MNRRVLLIFGLLAAVIVVFGLIVLLSSRGGTGTTAATTLKIWSPFDEGGIYQTMAAPFLTANSNVKLEFRHIQAENAKDYEAKVVDAIASGKGPDIWLIRNDWLPKHQPKLI